MTSAVNAVETNVFLKELIIDITKNKSQSILEPRVLTYQSFVWLCFPLWPPSNFLSSGDRGPFLRLVREAGHSSQFISDIKNAWSYMSTPQYVTTAWCFVCLSTGAALPHTLEIINWNVKRILWDMN
jgi:hypothetical protein